MPSLVGVVASIWFLQRVPQLPQIIIPQMAHVSAKLTSSTMLLQLPHTILFLYAIGGFFMRC